MLEEWFFAFHPGYVRAGAGGMVAPFDDRFGFGFGFGEVGYPVEPFGDGGGESVDPNLDCFPRIVSRRHGLTPSC